MAAWQLPTATAQHPIGVIVGVPLRLHPEPGASATLWLATRNPTDLIRATWAHEQEHGGLAETFTWADGVAIRSLQPPLVPFYPFGEVQAFAAVPACAGLFLPVGMGLRPAFRAAMWQGLRVPKAIQLFDGTHWLLLPQHGFRPVAEIVEIVSPRVQTVLRTWSKANEQPDDLAQLDATAGTTPTQPARASVAKAKAGFARQLRELFSSKEKAVTTTAKVDAESKPRASTRSRIPLREEIVQQLIRREQLGQDKEVQAWYALAEAYDEVDGQQAALARSHAAWLKDDLSAVNLGQGIRAVWLAALKVAHQRGGDSLYLATLYDRLLQQLEDGLDRVHDLPTFLWPTANDPVGGLIELRGLFVEHGPLLGIGAAVGGLLFATAALNCHEPRLATTWLTEARDNLKELRRSATTQSVLKLCEAVQRHMRIRTTESHEVVEPTCPQIASLTRRCLSFNRHRQRLENDDPEWFLLGGGIRSASAEKYLQEAEQERTAAVLPRNVLWLGAAGLCRTREEVGRWVTLVPDAIELQAEFWRTRWPGETQLFEVQVRWCERLITWATEDLRRHGLDSIDFLGRLLTQARERDTPLRLALANREWHVVRCIKESDKPSMQKKWLALGVLSSPSALLLRRRNREASKALDDLMHQLAEAPLETSATAQTAQAIFSACFLLPHSQALELGRNLTRSIARRLAQHGDEDLFAWKNLVALDGLLSTLYATPPPRNDELLAWVADDEQRIRKRMARDLARVLAAVN